jgi:hypothetical protein
MLSRQDWQDSRQDSAQDCPNYLLEDYNLYTSCVTSKKTYTQVYFKWYDMSEAMQKKLNRCIKETKKL